MLVLNVSAALADSQNSKPGKTRGASDPAAQSGRTADNPQRQSKPQDSGDQDRDQKQERDKDRDQKQENDKDCCNDNPGKGSERSTEMQERRDERKEDKARYKSDRVPGQEGQSEKGAQNNNSDKGTK